MVPLLQYVLAKTHALANTGVCSDSVEMVIEVNFKQLTRRRSDQ